MRGQVAEPLSALTLVILTWRVAGGFCPPPLRNKLGPKGMKMWIPLLLKIAKNWE